MSVTLKTDLCLPDTVALRVRRAVRGRGGRVSHLARLAAVGLGLALGALQQRRRERLAARRVAARERGGGGRGRAGCGRPFAHCCTFGERFPRPVVFVFTTKGSSAIGACPVTVPALAQGGAGRGDRSGRG